jgi:hypothetical protein
MKHPVIFTNTGGMYTRTELKNFVEFLFYHIFCHKYNPKAMADFYNTIEHRDMTRDSSFERIIVIPPPEVREMCDKIARGRKNLRQNEADIEAIIMAWCAENNVTPRHAVYTNRPAILFFDNDPALVTAKIVLNDLGLISDFERCGNIV